MSLKWIIARMEQQNNDDWNSLYRGPGRTNSDDDDDDDINKLEIESNSDDEQHNAVTSIPISSSTIHRPMFSVFTIQSNSKRRRLCHESIAIPAHMGDRQTSGRSISDAISLLRPPPMIECFVDGIYIINSYLKLFEYVASLLRTCRYMYACGCKERSRMIVLTVCPTDAHQRLPPMIIHPFVRLQNMRHHIYTIQHCDIDSQGHYKRTWTVDQIERLATLPMLRTLSIVMDDEDANQYNKSVMYRYESIPGEHQKRFDNIYPDVPMPTSAYDAQRIRMGRYAALRRLTNLTSITIVDANGKHSASCHMYYIRIDVPSVLPKLQSIGQYTYEYDRGLPEYCNLLLPFADTLTTLDITYNHEKYRCFKLPDISQMSKYKQLTNLICYTDFLLLFEERISIGTFIRQLIECSTLTHLDIRYADFEDIFVVELLVGLINLVKLRIQPCASKCHSIEPLMHDIDNEGDYNQFKRRRVWFEPFSTAAQLVSPNILPLHTLIIHRPSESLFGQLDVLAKLAPLTNLTTLQFDNEEQNDPNTDRERSMRISSFVPSLTSVSYK